MNNKSLLIKIYIILLIISIITLTLLSILGNKTRVGYLSEFKFDGVIDSTNEYITNYSYGFRLKYYDKVFRNSDIYNVYFDTNKILRENSFIEKIIVINGTPFGNLISNKKLDNIETIDNINYYLKLKSLFLSYFINIFLLIPFIYLIINFKKIIFKFEKGKVLYSKLDIFFQRNIFIYLIIFLAIILFLFNYWLVFPGYFQYADCIEIMGLAVTENYHNWHPIIISVFLNSLYKIFGYNTYYILILNLVLWYLSLCIIILSLYIKFNHRRLILLYLISFLANIFFLNMNHTKDSTAILFFMFSYSLILFSSNIKKLKLPIYILSIISLIIGMLWRLNFIVTVYPMFLFFVYVLLKKQKRYLLKFVGIMIIIAVILISILKVFPTFFIKDMYYSKLASNHLFLLQIAGCAAPSNDGSMIPSEWYLEGKNFEDLKKEYSKNKVNADPYGRAEYNRVYSVVFKGEKLEKLKSVWFKYIIKYPMNYIKHIINFSFHMCRLNTWKLDADSVSIRRTEKWLSDILDNFSKYQNIEFTKLRFNIYTFLYNFLFDINVIVFVILSVLLFFTSLFLFFIKQYFRNDILFLTFCLSFSSFSTLIIVCLFGALPLYRYIYPIVLIDIMTIISLIVFVYDIGGFSKFIEKLKYK